ncbi:hypothetical protein GF367_04515 [Candidatus Woesearchaeota archaeon]|nr:hypothetical protein [Candidatus Woesearchaeota archaeon]
MQTIAKQEHVSTNTVKKYLQQAGIKVKEQNRVKQLRTNDERLIGLYCGL